MANTLEKISPSALKIFGGIIGGIAFGPVLSMLIYIFFMNTDFVILLSVAVIGFLTGFAFGYKYPKETMSRALSSMLTVTFIGIIKRL